MFYNSRYNFAFTAGDNTVLYNSKSGATLNLTGKHSSSLADFLTGEKKFKEADAFDDSTSAALISGGFLVEEYRNELLEIKETYWNARGQTPVVLTITTTMDCNLGCYYCYESRTKMALKASNVRAIIEMLNITFEGNSKRSLHVDWYGGEPLLNLDFLENASNEIQSFCKERQINYHSYVISNGTIWPADLEPFINTHKIRQVQISFDGLRDNHNKRRRYLDRRKSQGSSFDEAVTLVDKLLDLTQVDIRFNIDSKNKTDVDAFIDMMIERKWFHKKYPAIFQPARISSYSEKSSFLSSKQLQLEDFDLIRGRVLSRLENLAKVEESEIPDGYPFPKTHVCAALAFDSKVVGADGLVYRCGLQVGEKHRAVGNLLGNNSQQKGSDHKWWNEFDPTQLSSCSQCSFLPVCFGGCPKKHLELDQQSMDEQSLYWRTNLIKKISKYIGMENPEPSILGEMDQFRKGY